MSTCNIPLIHIRLLLLIFNEICLELRNSVDINNSSSHHAAVLPKNLLNPLKVANLGAKNCPSSTTKAKHEPHPKSTLISFEITQRGCNYSVKVHFIKLPKILVRLVMSSYFA